MVEIHVSSIEELPKDAAEGTVATVDVGTLPPQAKEDGGGLRNVMLQAAIPPFNPDINHAWMILGQETQYKLQLQAEMLRRADEANGLHDATLAMAATITKLQSELGEARSTMAAMHGDFQTAHDNAITVNHRLTEELETTRNERDSLRDELSTLKLAKLKKEPKP